MNSAYILTGTAVLALEAGQLRSEWHGHSIPGDAQGRWLVVVNHVDDNDEAGLIGMPGVTPLPSVMSGSAIPGQLVAVLNGFGMGVTGADTTGSALDKIRGKWRKAAAQWH